MPACVACGELGEPCIKCATRDLPEGRRLYCIDVTLRGDEPERHAILVTGLTVLNNGPGHVTVFTSKTGDGTLLHPVGVVPVSGSMDFEQLKLADVWVQGVWGTHVKLAFRGGLAAQDPPAPPTTRFERDEVL